MEQKVKSYTVTLITASPLNSPARPKSVTTASKLLESKTFLDAKSPWAIYIEKIKNQLIWGMIKNVNVSSKNYEPQL